MSSRLVTADASALKSPAQYEYSNRQRRFLDEIPAVVMRTVAPRLLAIGQAVQEVTVSHIALLNLLADRLGITPDEVAAEEQRVFEQMRDAARTAAEQAQAEGAPVEVAGDAAPAEGAPSRIEVVAP